MPQPGPAPFLYVVGEVGEATPVKIGVSTQPARQRLAAYQGANWREVEYLYRRPLSIEQLVPTEFRVHQHLAPWWVTGEWFDVRLLEEQLGGWAALIDAALSQSIPGGNPFVLASTDGEHMLAEIVRHEQGAFRITCSCGHSQDHKGRLPLAVQRFSSGHLRVEWQRPFYRDERVEKRAVRRARNRT